MLVVEHARLESDLRMLRAECRDLPRQEVHRQRLTTGDAHGAAAQPLELLDLRFHALEIALLLAQVIDEDLAGRGEADAARAPLEQPRPELVFEVHDAAVDRRRG